MLIRCGILAVTLAGSAGVTIRTSVWSGAVPSITLKGHQPLRRPFIPGSGSGVLLEEEGLRKVCVLCERWLQEGC